jgi:hypothetical protein
MSRESASATRRSYNMSVWARQNVKIRQCSGQKHLNVHLSGVQSDAEPVGGSEDFRRMLQIAHKAERLGWPIGRDGSFARDLSHTSICVRRVDERQQGNLPGRGDGSMPHRLCTPDRVRRGSIPRWPAWLGATALETSMSQGHAIWIVHSPGAVDMTKVGR